MLGEKQCTWTKYNLAFSAGWEMGVPGQFSSTNNGNMWAIGREEDGKGSTAGPRSLCHSVKTTQGVQP